MTPDRWVGTRDRSWGIRPVGEAGAGRAPPRDPPFEGMWWTYVPMRFDEYAVVLILQEDPDGYRTLNDCHRIWRDGRVEQLGWPQVVDPVRLGHPSPHRRLDLVHDAGRQAAPARGGVAAAGADPHRRRLRRRPRLDPRHLEGARASPSGSPTT